jgi:hypothetical protein
MRVEVVLEVGVHEKMVPKCEVHENILLHVQKLTYGKNVYELKDHVDKEVMNLNLLPKLGQVKIIFLVSFPNCFLKNALVEFGFPCASMLNHKGAKQKHH